MKKLKMGGIEMRYWFTADQHFGHEKIIKYCDRPFHSVREMDNVIIDNFNSVVEKDDIVIHGGDFSFLKYNEVQKYIDRLNGQHTFLKGNHDYWLKGSRDVHEIWEKNCYSEKHKEKYHIVMSHYCLRTWNRSHYGSFHLFGHTHGTLDPLDQSWDVGVDNNNFFPVSLEEIIKIMKLRPANVDSFVIDKVNIKGYCIVCGCKIDTTVDKKFKNDPLVYICSSECEGVFNENF